MAFSLSEKSKQRLQGLHPNLVKVVYRALEITPIDFTVIEGLRTRERQKYLFDKGATRTLNSRHITGHAVDLAPLKDGKPSWNWEDYYPLSEAMKTAAQELGIQIEWGGDWTSFKDGPHWQLPK
jgi:hypothetical protein